VKDSAILPQETKEKRPARVWLRDMQAFENTLSILRLARRHQACSTAGQRRM